MEDSSNNPDGGNSTKSSMKKSLQKAVTRNAFQTRRKSVDFGKNKEEKAGEDEEKEGEEEKYQKDAAAEDVDAAPVVSAARARELGDRLIELFTAKRHMGVNAATLLQVVESGADVNLRYERVWDTACEGYQFTVGCTPLHFASRLGYVDVCEAIIAARADTNAQSECGVTPLMSAVMFGRVDVVKKLLANRADPNIVDQSGLSSVDFSVLEGKPDIIRILTATQVSSAQAKKFVRKKSEFLTDADPLLDEQDEPEEPAEKPKPTSPTLAALSRTKTSLKKSKTKGRK